MTAIEHLREILAASIAPPLSEVGIHLTSDRTGYTVACYEGCRGPFKRRVTVVRDKWWSKARGRFEIYLGVERMQPNDVQPEMPDPKHAEMPLASLIDPCKHDWKIWADDDAEPFITKIGTGMREFGIPWLVRLSDEEALTQWIKEEG